MSTFISSVYGGRHEYRALQNLLGWAALDGNLNDGEGSISLTSGAHSFELPLDDEVVNVHVRHDEDQRRVHFDAQEIQHELGVYGRLLRNADPTTVMIYSQTVWPGGMDVRIELDEHGAISRAELNSNSNITRGAAEYTNVDEALNAVCPLEGLVRLTEGVDRISFVDPTERADDASRDDLNTRLVQLLDGDDPERPAGRTTDLTTVIEDWLPTLQAPDSAVTYLRQVLAPLTTLPVEHRLLDDAAVTDVQRILSNFEPVYSSQTEMEWAQHSVMLRWLVFHRLRLSQRPLGTEEMNDINRVAASTGSDLVAELRRILAARSDTLNQNTASVITSTWESNVVDMAGGDGLMLAVASRSSAWRKAWLQRAADELLKGWLSGSDLETKVQNNLRRLVQLETIKAFRSDEATVWEIDPFGIEEFGFMSVSLESDGPRCLFSGPIGWRSDPLEYPSIPDGCGVCDVCESVMTADD